MSRMDTLKESNEHRRYKIAYRVYRMIALMEKRSYTMNEIAADLGISPKTARRMMHALESMGIPFFDETPARWRILK